MDKVTNEKEKEIRTGWLIAGTFRRWERIIIRAQAEAGIDQDTIGYGKILGFIERKERENVAVYQKDIERDQALNKSTVSMILTSLEKKGLVKRESVKTDARLKRIVLTDLGREKSGLLHTLFHEIDRELYGNITEEEQEMFDQVMRKISDNLKKKEEEMNL